MKTHIILIVLAGLILSGYSCTQGGMFGIRGEGPVVQRKLDIRAINGISVPGSARVYLTQGASQSVTVEGQENLIENLSLDVDGDVWKMSNKQPVWQSKPLKIMITMKELTQIRVSGSGDVETTGLFTGDEDLDIKISGSGTARLEIEANDVTADISGSGSIRLSGKADDLDLRVTGSGSIDAFELQSSRADVRVTGSGDIRLAAEEKIDAHLSGSGSVLYKGNPSINSSVTGSGTIRKR